jgi:hypothetical protein
VTLLQGSTQYSTAQYANPRENTDNVQPKRDAWRMYFP